MKKILKHLFFSITLLLSVCITNLNVDAKTMSKEDIPGSTYIIGTYMFTRDINQEKKYDGKLTTNLIMLASQTIESKNLDDINIYYKTAAGKWINGLTGNEITVPDNLKINYTNLSLEEENDTVKAPKKPIIFWDGPVSYDENTNKFLFTLNIMLDDINDKTNKIDGVELLTEQGRVNSYDLKYNDNFKSTTCTINKDFKKNVDGLAIGNSYHCYQMTIETVSDQTLNINAKAYVLDENGKMIYSNHAMTSIKTKDILPTVKVKSSYSNPSYVSKENGYYNYMLEIEKPDGLSYTSDKNKYAYVLYKNVDNNTSQVGIFGLDEKVMVTIPKNEIVTYYAVIGYYKNNGDFVHYYSNNQSDKELIIDTRELTTPTLSIYNWSWNDRMRNGERITINNNFYKTQNEGTLDYNFEGTEFYEISYLGEPWKLMVNYKIGYDTTKYSWFKDFKPTGGHKLYAARVYATNATGEKVYSDFSNKVEVIRTPEIAVSEVKEGKAIVSIVNKEEYGLPGCLVDDSGLNKLCFKYKIYTDDDVELKDIRTISDDTTIDVSKDMNIYVKVYNNSLESSGTNPVYVYSSSSNIVSVKAN